MNTFLLDTHTLIWFGTDPSKLSANATQAIINAEQVYVSFATAWEYVIKRSLGRPEFSRPFTDIMLGAPVLLLAVEFDVYAEIESLPPIHRDPFDRLLIAQALHHDLTLISKDKAIAKYPVRTIW